MSHIWKRLAMFACVCLWMLSSRSASALSQNKPQITVEYFFNNPCSSCKEEGKFHDKFIALAGESMEDVTVEFIYHNVFQQFSQDNFIAVCDQYGIPPENRNPPLVIIGGTALAGTEEIDTKLASVFLAEKEKALRQAAGGDETVSKVVYFSVSACEDCEAVKQYLDSLPDEIAVNYNGRQITSTLLIESYNVSDARGLELVKQEFSAYGVPDKEQTVPVVFYRGGYLSGREEIIGGLLSAIESGQCVGAAVSGVWAAIRTYEWSAIFLAGLVNGFNPCSVSMLLFLITMLLARKANLLKAGAFFLLGKFLAYLALGTLLYGMLSLVDSHVISLFGGVMRYGLLAVAFVAAAVNINDFIAAKNEKYSRIRLQLPVGLRKLNHNWIREINDAKAGLLPCVSLLLGMAVSAGEFLCTGQIYLATILYLLKQSPEMNFPLFMEFLVYILGMLLPLAVTMLIIEKGRSVYDVSEAARKNMPVIKLINAAVFAAFAMLILALF